MPSFTAQVPNLQTVGPVVELRLSIGTAVESTLKASGPSVPPPIPALGMIDTGATSSVMREGFAECLIGRDVLAHGVLVYIGYGNLFSLSF